MVNYRQTENASVHLYNKMLSSPVFNVFLPSSFERNKQFVNGFGHVAANVTCLRQQPASTNSGQLVIPTYPIAPEAPYTR